LSRLAASVGRWTLTGVGIRAVSTEPSDHSRGHVGSAAAEDEKRGDFRQRWTGPRGAKGGRVHSRFSREGNISDGQCVHGMDREPTDRGSRSRLNPSSSKFILPYTAVSHRYSDLSGEDLDPLKSLDGPLGFHSRRRRAWLQRHRRLVGRLQNDQSLSPRLIENSHNCRTKNPGRRALEGEGGVQGPGDARVWARSFPHRISAGLKSIRVWQINRHSKGTSLYLAGTSAAPRESTPSTLYQIRRARNTKPAARYTYRSSLVFTVRIPHHLRKRRGRRLCGPAPNPPATASPPASAHLSPRHG
jgi:hypothetical protein